MIKHQQLLECRSRSVQPFLAGATRHTRRHQVALRALEPFNESAAQVKRLISRDRKEFLGNSADILDKFNAEFDTTAPAAQPSNAATTVAPSKPAAPAAAAAASAFPPKVVTLSADNPFGKATSASPFPKPAPPPKSSMEPVGLRPDMGPDPIIKEQAFSFFENITLTQVVIVMSFTLIIALMIGTFFFVLNVGGVRLNGI